MMYHVFHRTWWRDNPSWPNGLEPHAGEKTYLVRYVTSLNEAIELCREYNDSHESGRYSRKAEFEDA